MTQFKYNPNRKSGLDLVSDSELSGEANTSSNEGVGIGLSLPKVGVNLPFRTLKSSDSSISITIDGNEIDVKTGPASGVTFSGVTFAGFFTDYDDLNVSDPAGPSNRFAYVLSSQGSPLLPGSEGGDYYNAGWYYDNGVNWIDDKSELTKHVYDLSEDSLKPTIIKTSTNYTAKANDIVLITTNSSDITISLPPVVSNIDSVISIKKIDSGSGKIIVDGNSTELIDDEETQEINFKNTSITVVSDGLKWFII